ncbi:extracellular matrix protein 2 [Hemibagrus wyckioides]|uniref:extracellular matrix protein 2 n=1 Tax=Hemibagrus wyckioides TaxID=337641 RepID=UPI00266CFFB2|nr:extracellular matrix protein 2 [Hemibagrus wyckioides]
MRLWLLLAVSFFCWLSCSVAKEQNQSRPMAKGRRRRGKKMVRQGRVPVDGGYNGASVFIESYKGVEEPKPNYNVIPGNTGQCVFQGITMFDKTVWSPKPCVTCLCSNGNVVCDEMQCPLLQCKLKFKPIGQCCPICIESTHEVSENSGDSPVPNDPSITDAAFVPNKSSRREKYKEEEERILRKDAERKRRKKQKKETEKQRKKLEEQKRAEEMRKLQEEAQKRAEAEIERWKRMEEQQRVEEERMRRREREERERLRTLEEAAERARNELRAEEDEEEEEQEETVWLRGDVFQMPPQLPTPLEFPPPTAPSEPSHAGEGEGADEESARISYVLPQGCTVSDVIVSCENAKLTSIPPLSIPELKSLNLHGNAITTIPAEAFNGVLNLEWIDFGKNKILSSGIDPQAFTKLQFLTRLYMDGNLLEHIPPGLPHTLQELKINENNLQEMDEDSFEGLSNLVTLEMEGNLLSEANVNPKVFAPLKQLSYLRLGRNHFRTIPQGLPVTLQELHLENNLIEEISDGAFNQSKNLNVVVLRHNKIDESRISPFAWINHRNLESIDLAHNKLHLVPSFLPKSLVHLVLVGNQIERIPGFVFAHMEPGLEYLYLSYNKLDGEGVEPESFFGTFNTMTELCLDHNQLTCIPVGVNEMTSLHFLRLNNNNIRHIGEDSICDPMNDEDSHIVALRLENNLLDPRKIPPTAFSCVRSYSSVVLRPQRIK